MDNAIVLMTSVAGLILSQYTTGMFENATIVSIVAFVVYYFTTKFDKKLDNIEDLAIEIHKRVSVKEKEE